MVLLVYLITFEDFLQWEGGIVILIQVLRLVSSLLPFLVLLVHWQHCTVSIAGGEAGKLCICFVLFE